MRPITHLLCPVDFSDSSRFALRTAAIIAEHLGAHLTVVTVDDPLLAQVAAQVTPSLTGATESELQRFAAAAMMDVSAPPAERTHLIVAVGQPAPLILQSARDAGANLIVMSSQGRSGARKMFFGSTAERVLRDTTLPVLITRGDGASGSATTALDQSGPVVVPVDLGDGAPEHLGVASGVATALAAPLVLMHVLEPVFVQEAIALAFGLDEVRRRTARERLAEVAAGIPATISVETLLAAGQPAEEIAKAADDRQARLIVVGLRAAGAPGSRLGSVTYRVLCLSRVTVLALPPVRGAE
jgi:nucleotide-binding universal stress UspA family protein